MAEWWVAALESLGERWWAKRLGDLVGAAGELPLGRSLTTDWSIIGAMEGAGLVLKLWKRPTGDLTYRKSSSTPIDDSLMAAKLNWLFRVKLMFNYFLYLFFM